MPMLLMPFWWWDPLTLLALVVAYVAGFLVLQFLAIKVAPAVSTLVAGRLTLYTAMALTAALIAVGGGLLAYLVCSAAAAAGFKLPLLAVVAFVVATNLLAYLAAPFMINAAYNARPDPVLQEIVNEAAARAGIKPPKAVVVEGPPNAFAYGNFLSGRYVAVSRSLMSMLGRDELMAVVGHEIGHHKHRDTVLMLLLGLVPSVLYYMGFTMIRAGLWASAESSSERRGGGGLLLLGLGVLSVVASFIMQVLVLAFSRLREYYADMHGALVAGVKPMQRALAKLYLYYSSRPGAVEALRSSSLKALFIYALVDAVASPLYSSVDQVIEELKRVEVNPAEEIFMDHPPIPKRIRFLDSLRLPEARA